MAAVAAIEQGAVQGSLQQPGGDCQACKNPTGSEDSSTVNVRQQAQTRAVIRLRASSVSQVFSAKLMSSVRATVSGTSSGYDSGDSVVPQFLRAVAAKLDTMASLAGRQAVIDDARASVDAAAADAQTVVDEQGEAAEGSRASLLNGLTAGLNELQRRAESQPRDGVSASQTTFTHESRGKLALNIRTQDGDVVRLRFKVDQVADAVSEQLDDGNIRVSQSSVYVASDQHFRVAIRGHLDEGELSAIQDVLAQADRIAQSVLAGDFEAVLDGLASFGFDNDELTTVGMRMRVREHMQMSHSEISSMPMAGLPPKPVGESLPVTAEQMNPATSDAESTVNTEPATPEVTAPVPADPRNEQVDEGGGREPMSNIAQVLHEFMASTRIDTTVRIFDKGAHSRVRLDRELVMRLVESFVEIRGTSPDETPMSDAVVPDGNAAEPPAESLAP